jgi:hypothetical protein
MGMPSSLHVMRPSTNADTAYGYTWCSCKHTAAAAAATRVTSGSQTMLITQHEATMARHLLLVLSIS